MTELAQTAVEFVRKCLGWEKPVDRRFAETNRNATGDGGSKAWTPYIFDYYAKHDQFHYTDLNAVIAAVRGWCDKADGSVEMSYYGYVPGEWEARVGTPVSVETMVHADPCYALLSACLAAARKLMSA